MAKGCAVSSVAYEFEGIPLLVPHRPPMTLTQRICTDTARLVDSL